MKKEPIRICLLFKSGQERTITTTRDVADGVRAAIEKGGGVISLGGAQGNPANFAILVNPNDVSFATFVPVESD